MHVARKLVSSLRPFARSRRGRSTSWISTLPLLVLRSRLSCALSSGRSVCLAIRRSRPRSRRSTAWAWFLRRGGIGLRRVTSTPTRSTANGEATTSTDPCSAQSKMGSGHAFGAWVAQSERCRFHLNDFVNFQEMMGLGWLMDHSVRGTCWSSALGSCSESWRLPRWS